MNVLSLFDGMSCGQIALRKLGIVPDKYFASEIDKFAIKTTMTNFPNTIQLGSVVDVDGYSLPEIDLLIGGSPCQLFSFAGKRKGMVTTDNEEILTLDRYLELKKDGFEFEGQSYLFWEYMRILNEVKPKYFLLENVMMGKKWKRILSQAIGINPIMINSSLVSAQNRERLYWTNIYTEQEGFFGGRVCKIPQPKDKGILLKDILEKEVDEKYFLGESQLTRILNKKPAIDPEKSYTCVANNNTSSFGNDRSATLISALNDNGILKENFSGKSNCIDANYQKGMDNHSPLTMIVHNTMPRSSKTSKGGTGHLSRSDGKTYCLDTGKTNVVEFKENYMQADPTGKGHDSQYNRYYYVDSKTNNVDASNPPKIIFRNGNSRIRRLTPLEVCRLQTVPDDYFFKESGQAVSDTQIYKQCGNGWTVDVIAHILSYMDK